jgi:RNA methyltransferase, TrmH family
MLPITSPQNPTIKLVRSLSDKKGRRETGLFVAEGFQMLERALALGWKPEHLIATKPPHLWDDVKPTLVSEKLMAEISAQNNPHDVMATFKQRLVPQPSREGVVLALEEIRDPGNLGTILRTADAADVTGIVLAGDCCDPYSPDCVRASTGSIFNSQLTRMPVEKLVDHIVGWPGESVATMMGARTSYRRTYRSPTMIVMGSEARGLSVSVIKACTTQVSIPMRDGVESLNVAIASALMLFEVLK